MTSLFSPFDVFFFSKSLIGFFFLFMVTGFLSFTCSSVKIFIKSLFLYLSTFFCSLKSKSMNKFSLPLFILVFFTLFLLNFFSVFSYSFPLTSQVSLVLWVALGVWFSLVLFSLISSWNKFLSHLVPEGTPMALIPLLFVIELVSNIIRPTTLTVRLVANILAGHLLMSLLSSLVFSFPLCFPLYMLLNTVELFVALIQSYIFSTMLVLYFSEV